MSIISLNKLEVNGFKATTTNKLKFYKGDRLNLSFSISNKLISEIDSQEVINGILPINSHKIKTYMIIEGKEIVGTIIKDNNIIFKFGPEHQTLGINKFQIIIAEIQEDGSKEILHTPPFTIEIEEPLFSGDLPQDDVAKVNYAIVNKSIVANSTEYIEINSSYQMTIWKPGDLITADKLNNIEQALFNHAQKLDELLYKAITINTFTLSKTIAELGEKLIGLTLNWSYNKIPTYQKLDNVLIDNELRKYVVENEISSNTSFILEASDGKTIVNKNATINFYNGRYYGVSNLENYDSNFILSLNKTLTNSRACSFTVDCGQGQYIFFAIPTRFGTPTFTVGGFTGGFTKVATVDFTNASGYTEPYNIYKSDYSNLGNTTVVVG